MMTGKQGIGFAACAALVVANMVGTGVFTSLGFQLAEIPSPPAVMLLWLLGGVLALCGALCYAELSAALPRSGGEYHFLGRIFHPALGFMAGLVSIVIGFAAPCALAALAFGSYLHGVWPAAPPLASSCGIIALVTAVHLRTLALSSAFQVTFTTLKIALVVFLSFALLGRATSVPSPVAPWTDYLFSAPFAVSLMYTLYAYSGWNAATYVLGEVRAPARVVPAALATGTLVVTGLYLALNHAFLRAAPASALAGELNVAQIAAGAVFGEPGGKIVAAVIAAGLVSALSAMVWAGPRVAMVIAEDHPRFFGFLRRRNAGGIPVRAVLCQSLLSLALLLTATFEQVLVYAQLALLTCGFLTVTGLVVLRRREPGLPRPFRVPLYPLPPLLFLAISGFAIVYTAASRPREALCGVLTMTVCFALYYVSRSPRDPQP